MHTHISILTFAQEYGLCPKRTASTNGGEYHAACPACGGKDRFILWPVKDRFWCRQCNKSGDSIQFCREFFHMTFKEACHKAQKEHFEIFCEPTKKTLFASLTWQEKANDFVISSFNRLISDAQLLQKIKNRGLTIETLYQCKIGWNPVSRFHSYSEWGLLPQYKQNGQERKLWLPSGFVIPTFFHERPIKLKIRTDGTPKYVEIAGSSSSLSFFGHSVVKPHVLLESELDAILLFQEVGDLCVPVALGGATREPDAHSHELLQKAPLILFALDFDTAGKKAYTYWKSRYPNLFAWPTPYAKSAGDAFKAGFDLRKWIASGIAHCDQRLQVMR